VNDDQVSLQEYIMTQFGRRPQFLRKWKTTLIF
jgi:hypothetical protein